MHKVAEVAEVVEVGVEVGVGVGVVEEEVAGPELQEAMAAAAAPAAPLRTPTRPRRV
jgi:hypothetical protein